MDGSGFENSLILRSKGCKRLVIVDRRHPTKPAPYRPSTTHYKGALRRCKIGLKRILELGSRFGRLVVVQDMGVTARRSYYLCKCDCGSEISVQTKRLVSSHTRSCGCLKLDVLADRSTTHGLSAAPEYGVWQDVKKRCFNPNHKFYAYYGGRGITVCPEWLHDFEAFYRDMGKRPFVGAEIDRKDNTGNYRPDNCEWVTRIANMRNTRFNRILEYNGELKCLAEWAEMHNIKSSTLWDRLSIGWSIHRALTEPVRRY